MAGLRFAELQSRPIEFLDFTSLTLDEFQQLVPPFEAAFHARMAAWRMDGKPRTARRFTVYQNCPLPTPEDRLFEFMPIKSWAAKGSGAPGSYAERSRVPSSDHGPLASTSAAGL
jgi:hypothetical protein